MTCRLRIYSLRMIRKVSVKSDFLQLFFRQIAGQLVNHGSHDLQMPQLAELLTEERQRGTVLEPIRQDYKKRHRK